MKMASPGGAFGVRRPGRSVRFEVPDLPWDDVGHRQGLRDRLDEAVGEDEHDFLQSLAEQGAAMEGSRVPGGFGVVSPSRVSPGSFTQDPGMRARDEFTDITSRGYNEQAKRVAERGGAKEYATSVEQEAAEGRNDRLRNEIGLALAMLASGGMLGGAGAGWGAARAAGGTVPNALRAAGHGALSRSGALPSAAFSPGHGYRPPPGYRPWGTAQPGYLSSMTPESLALREAAARMAAAQERFALHAGRGPGYRGAVARNAGNRGGIQSPMRPQPARPAVRDFGPPPRRYG